jgi:hypothetical protein
LNDTDYRGFTITRSKVIKAMALFDRDRASFPSKRWVKYAIDHDGRLYPPKQIMRLITGTEDVGNGGHRVNSRYENLGFSVVTILDARLGADEGEEPHLIEYSPDGVDRREVVNRQIRSRRGQSQFREALRKRFGDRCAVTGSSIVALLEAAHISPHRGELDNNLANGLLLRADVHTLFDLYLLAIHPQSLRIELHPSIECEYGELAGKPIRRPRGIGLSLKALQQRFDSFCFLRDQPG